MAPTPVMTLYIGYLMIIMIIFKIIIYVDHRVPKSALDGSTEEKTDWMS